MLVDNIFKILLNFVRGGISLSWTQRMRTGVVYSL